MDTALVFGIVGTATGIIALCISILETMQERPIIKIGNVLLWLEKKGENKVTGKLSFNVDNVGDRSTTVTLVNVIFGDHVETYEKLRDVAPHSSIRYPEPPTSEISLFTSFKGIDNLRIIVKHTHNTIKKEFSVPQISEWDKNALWEGGPMVLEL
jgi:hypothetical protein